MEIIDKILNQWSFRCNDGIVDMNDPKKKTILEEILKEFNVDLDERGRPKKAEIPETKPEDENSWEYVKYILKNEAGVKDEIILKEIEAIYSKENPSEFSKHFRKYNIKDIDKVFSIFKNYVDVGSKKRGVGKGEFAVILGVADSKSGGIAEKDIVVGKDTYDADGKIIANKDIYDVKELTKAGDLRTGSSGYITNSKFQLNYSYLMSLLVAIDKNNGVNISGIEEEIKNLVDYFREKYKKGNISEGILNRLKEILPKLSKYKFESESKDNVSYIKVNGKKYEISNINKDESGNPISITLGSEVDEQKALIIKLV